ncbi:MAG: hypothetical protein QM811_15835 [Pirellulales bacterium]
MSHPWADTLRFHDLTLIDPETGATLAHMPELDVVRDEKGILATARVRTRPRAAGTRFGRCSAAA